MFRKKFIEGMNSMPQSQIKPRKFVLKETGEKQEKRRVL